MVENRPVVALSARSVVAGRSAPRRASPCRALVPATGDLERTTAAVQRHVRALAGRARPAEGE